MLDMCLKITILRLELHVLVAKELKVIPAFNSPSNDQNLNVIFN